MFYIDKNGLKEASLISFTQQENGFLMSLKDNKSGKIEKIFIINNNFLYKILTDNFENVEIYGNFDFNKKIIHEHENVNDDVIVYVANKKKL